MCMHTQGLCVCVYLYNSHTKTKTDANIYKAEIDLCESILIVNWTIYQVYLQQVK